MLIAVPLALCDSSKLEPSSLEFCLGSGLEVAGGFWRVSLVMRSISLESFVFGIVDGGAIVWRLRWLSPVGSRSPVARTAGCGMSAIVVRVCRSLSQCPPVVIPDGESR